MADEWTDGQKTRIAVAELIGALVKTLGETDATIPGRFNSYLEDAYHRVKGYENSPTEVLEAIEWSAKVAMMGET
jgi:hypothetical protein